MRILHLTTEFPPVIYGGLGTAVGGWVTASDRAGLSVAVQLVEGPLVLDAGSASAHYGYGYGYGGRGGSPRPARSAHLSGSGGVPFFQSSWSDAVELGIGAVRTWRPDVVHLHTAMLWYVAEAIQVATATPIVYHVHSVDRAEYEIGHEPNPWLAHSHAQDLAIAASDRLIALTGSESDLLKRYYPTMRGKVRVVGNGIDDSEGARAAAFSPRPPGSPLVLYSGRLVERKGIRELLDAIPDVLDAVPDACFVLAGGPPPLSGDEVATQWLTARHATYRDRIHFTGWLSPEDVYRWYSLADVLVVPSRYEPFGMVVLEGMLHGLPVIAADVGGPADILEHGRTGLLFPPRNVTALAAALRRLVENGEERRQMGYAAAREVRRRWLWERLVPGMIDVYREFLPLSPSVLTLSGDTADSNDAV
jgi:glycogen(starch) synthase